MMVATKFMGDSVAMLSLPVNRGSPFSRIDRIARSRFPYSCSTPLGFPVVPEV